MKKAMLTVMVLALSVIFATAVMAVEQKAPASPAATPAPSLEKYSGVVERVDVAKKDFSVKSGKEEMTFSWTDKTKITEGKKTLSFADLKKGQEVSFRSVPFLFVYRSKFSRQRLAFSRSGRHPLGIHEIRGAVLRLYHSYVEFQKNENDKNSHLQSGG